MKAFFRPLLESLTRGPVALLTIVAARGSTPRTHGAMQFIDGSGRGAGTIGGGATEGRALELARETLADGQPRVIKADLRGRPDDIRDGICGGTMEVWIVRLEPNRDLTPVTAGHNALSAGRRITLSLRLSTERPLAINTEDEPSSPDAFVEIIVPSPHLLIIGAGHIGRCLAALATGLDFAVSVQDERPAWLDPAAFPADCRLDPELEPALATLRRWEGPRFAALVTRGFAQDLEALRQLVTIDDLNYLGLLGSRTRIATVLAAHRAAGLPLPDESVLHAPIGIKIGAETPEEIAVSIAAELIRTRRTRT